MTIFGPASVTTVVKNAADKSVVTTTLPFFSSVYDTVIVAATHAGDPVPTGKVTFTFFTNGT